MQVFHPEWDYDNHITAILEVKSMMAAQIMYILMLHGSDSMPMKCHRSLMYYLKQIQLTKSESSLPVEVLMPLLVHIVK